MKLKEFAHFVSVVCLICFFALSYEMFDTLLYELAGVFGPIPAMLEILGKLGFCIAMTVIYIDVFKIFKVE